jgi:acetyl esterase/lipase
MAVSLAQAGAVVAVISYTLYPEALASEMAGEVLAALVWTCQEIAQYGGDASRISVVGHSAGGHLAALALMMLAQQRQQALEAAAVAAAEPEDGGRRQWQQVQQQGRHVQGQEPGSSLQQQRLPAQQQQKQLGSQQSQQQQQQQQYALLQQQQGQHLQRPLLQHHPQQQQQQQQRRRPLWYIPDPLALPQPLLFVGMSSVYDVGLHFEFESMRGVAGISTMARACGGAAMFDAVSPAVLLKQAAAAAAVATRHQVAGPVATAVQPGSISNQQQVLRPVQWPQLPAGAAAAAAASYHFTPAELGSRSLQRFSRQAGGGFAVSPGGDARQQQQQQQQQLHGEVIPIRIGMQQPHAANSNSSTLSNPGAAVAPESNTPSSSSHSTGSTSFGDAATLLRGFSVADAAQLPPFVLMSSCGDHMVPWHEAADMALALQACGVPAKHLIYDRFLHNDFVLDWSPAVVAASGAGSVAAAEAAAERAIAAPAAAAAAAAGGGVSEVSRVAASSSGGDSMPAFAQDLVSIVTGRVQLQFSSSNTAIELAAAADGRSMDAAAAGGSSEFRTGRWFAVQPHSRL